MVTKFERTFFRPQIYKTFTNDDEEFIIQDLPTDRIQEAAEFMIEFYATGETFMKAIKVSESLMVEFFLFVFKENCALGCFKKESNEMVGISALSVKTKGIDTSFKVNLEAMFSSVKTLPVFRPTIKFLGDADKLLRSSTINTTFLITTTS